jgi:hypothetical protein
MKHLAPFLLAAALLWGVPAANAQIVYGSGLPQPVVNGECIIGSGGIAVWGSCSGSGTAVTSVTGTTGQVTVSPTTGATVVSLPATITQATTFSTGLTGIGNGVTFSPVASTGPDNASPGLQVSSTSSNYFGLGLRPTGTIAAETFSELSSFGTAGSNPSYMELNFAEGTPNAPLAVHANDILGYLIFSGYNGTAYTSPVHVYGLADQTFDSTHGGGSFHIGTTVLGSPGSFPDRFVIASDGSTNILSQGLVVGTPTGANKGVGTINLAASGLYDNGTGPTGTGAYVHGTSPSLTTPTIAGATLSGTLGGTPTFSGNLTFSGVPLFTGLSAGTQTKCLGLDSGNNVVYNAAACGSGGGGSLTVTDGTNSVSSTTTLTVGSGFLVGGSAGSATLNTTNTINTQSGTGAYAILAGDAGKQVLRTNASGGADTIANATGSFGSGYSTTYTTTGFAGNTITPTTANINGLSVLKLGSYQYAALDSDGTNYHAALSLPQPSTQTGTTYLADDMTWKTTALGANPTGTAGPSAVNGSATTFMRSDAAPAIQKATSGQFGIVEVDGTTITASGGVITATAGGSGCTVSGAAGIVLNNGSSACTTDTNATLSAGALSLGASGTAGSVAMGNATTGTVTLQPVTGALGSVTASLPANTGTLGELNLAQTWTAKQTFTGSGPIEAGANGGNVGSVKLYGNTSGDVTIKTAAAAGTATVFQLPATNGANTNVLQTDGTGVTSWVAAGSGSGAMTLISTLTANNTATSISWTGLTLDDYVVRCRGLVPATNATKIDVQLGEGGTPTWETTGYYTGATYNSVGSATGGPISSSNVGSITADVGTIGNTTATDGLTGKINFYGLSQAIRHRVDYRLTIYDGSTGTYTYIGVGQYQTDQNAITAIRLIAESGNLKAGSCSLYSIAD